MSDMKILAQAEAGISVPEYQPSPSVKLAASPEPLASAGSKPHLLYKSLLNEHAQKLRKPPPVFNTQNYGFVHMPKFKSTVLFDGVSYTSTNTFQQRKMAETDVSRIAYISITQKFKSDALQFIREDKTICKSILMEFAAKMKIKRPEYETNQLGTFPAFRSSLVFNGVAYLGDYGKTKKESEQLAARSVILKYLGSESGLDVSEIINCKFRQMNKIREMSNCHNGLNVSLIEPKAKLGISTMQNFSPSVTQSRVQEASIQTIMQTIPAVTQPPIPEVSIAPSTAAVSVVNQPPIPKVIFKKSMPGVPTQVILTHTASAEINNSATPFVVSTPSLGTLSSVPATPLASIVIQPANSITSPSLASESLNYIPLTGKTSRKKRKTKEQKECTKENMS